MSAETKTSEYLLLFRGGDWDQVSPEELQQVMGRFMAWVNKLTEEGIVKAAQPLELEGKTVSGKNRTVADGPFAESKEAVGGYFLVSLPDFDAAVELAKDHPLLEYGLTVEVRPIVDQCPAMKLAGMQLAHSSA